MQQANAALLRFDTTNALGFYRHGIGVLTDTPSEVQWRYTLQAAYSLLQFGDRAGRNEALLASIELHNLALQIAAHHRRPLDWATTQNNLGIALQTLGERENGTARLEEAVAAYHAALAEWTRERVPLQWAMTQSNLSNVFLTLGARESGTARLEEAVAACRAALEEWTRYPEAALLAPVT